MTYICVQLPWREWQEALNEQKNGVLNLLIAASQMTGEIIKAESYKRKY